jgi:predicted ribonuclease YlaK
MSKKTYILDTNVLLSDTDCLTAFEEHNVVIPMAVLEELDRHKSRSDEVGRNARQISRSLDDMRSKGSLFEGVALKPGGRLKVVSIESSALELLPFELRDSKVDNLIIAFMLSLKNSNTRVFEDSQVSILVSKDINVRLKCDSLSIKCEDYRKTRVVSSFQQMYRGVEVIEVHQDVVEDFYQHGKLEIIDSKFYEKQLFANEIVVIKCVVGEKTVSSAITRYDSESKCLVPIEKVDQAFGLKPRNKEQVFSLDLLFNPDIKLITMTGAAGCVVPETVVSTILLEKGTKVNNVMVPGTASIGPISEIKDLLSKYDVYIGTPSGYHPVINFVDKPNKRLLKVTLEGGFELTCSDDHLLLHEGKWILAKEVFERRNEKIKLSTIDGDKSVLEIVDKGIGHCVDITVECLENHYYSAGITSHNCGKTLLALASALEQTKGIGGSNAMYNKLVVTRPIQPVGKELGFLPGTLEEKMEPWIAPIRDNFNFLISGKKNFRPRKHSNSSYDQKRSGRDDGSYLSLLQEKGLIEIEAITFIRGRSIPDSFIIIDEAQNLSVHELKTIITRVGDGTKIVLTGDLEQIDNVHVDAFSNGLSYAIEKFKDYPIAAHVTLLKGERSELATLASQIL